MCIRDSIDTIQEVEEKAYSDAFGRQAIVPVDKPNTDQQASSQDFLRASSPPADSDH